MNITCVLNKYNNKLVNHMYLLNKNFIKFMVASTGTYTHTQVGTYAQTHMYRQRENARLCSVLRTR